MGRRPHRGGGRRRHHQRGGGRHGIHRRAAGHPAGRHRQRAGHGDEVGQTHGTGGGAPGGVPSPPHPGGPFKVRPGRFAPFSTDGRRWTGCAHREARESRFEGADRQVRLLGGGLEPAGPPVGAGGRGDRREPLRAVFVCAGEQGTELRRRLRDCAGSDAVRRPGGGGAVRRAVLGTLCKVLRGDGAEPAEGDAGSHGAARGVPEVAALGRRRGMGADRRGVGGSVTRGDSDCAEGADADGAAGVWEVETLRT